MLQVCLPVTEGDTIKLNRFNSELAYTIIHDNCDKPLEAFDMPVSVDRGAGGIFGCLIGVVNEAIRACLDDIEDWYLHNN